MVRNRKRRIRQNIKLKENERIIRHIEKKETNSRGAIIFELAQ